MKKKCTCIYFRLESRGYWPNNHLPTCDFFEKPNPYTPEEIWLSNEDKEIFNKNFNDLDRFKKYGKKGGEKSWKPKNY